MIKLVKAETSPVESADSSTYTYEASGISWTGGTTSTATTNLQFTAANPCVFTWPSAHGFVGGKTVLIITNLGGGSGPALNTPLYVLSTGLTTTQFQVSTSSPTGNALNTTGGTASTTASATAYVSATGTFTIASHGLVANNTVVFTNLGTENTGGVLNPVKYTTYYVLSSGLTTDTFQLSTSKSGTPLTVTIPTTGAIANVSPYDNVIVRPRIPFVVRIGGLTQNRSRYGVTLASGSSKSTSDPINNTIVGFGAVNGDTANNPSIHCYIPQSPQQWTFTVSQLGYGASYMGGAQFTLMMVFQITPITQT